MKHLSDVEQKEMMAKKIKELVEEINLQINVSNQKYLGLNISFQQNNNIKPANSHLNVFITETVGY